MDIVGRIVEGLRDRPDTHHSSPSLVLQGAKAAFMMKDDGNEGKEIQACSMGDDAQQSISDALSVPVLTKIMTGIDKDDQFKDWFVLPETWIRAKKNQLKGRTPSRQDQTLMNKAEQIGNELGRGLSTLQNSAREGGAIIGAIVFPPYLEIGLLKDQEDTERFVFNTFKGGTLTSLLYDVPIGNKVAVERQLKKGIGKSDPEYGTFAS